MIAYELRPGGRYNIWVTNEHGKEPLGSLCRDTEGHWFYEPLAGSYMYLGALVDIANKLFELSEIPNEPASDATAEPKDPSRRNFAVIEGEGPDGSN